jgi:hypothetical protein
MLGQAEKRGRRETVNEGRVIKLRLADECHSPDLRASRTSPSAKDAEKGGSPKERGGDSLVSATSAREIPSASLGAGTSGRWESPAFAMTPWIELDFIP